MKLLKKLFSKPKTETLTVTSSNGFHLRPVAQFVSMAKSFTSEITASTSTKSVNAKSVSTLLSLNLEPHDSFILSCHGKDAQEALSTLKKLFSTLMQEDKEVDTHLTHTHQYKTQTTPVLTLAQGVGIGSLFSLFRKDHYLNNNTSFTQACTLSTEALEILYQTQTKNNPEIYLAQKELLLSLCEHVDTLEEFETLIHTQSQALQGGKLASKGIDYLDILERVKSYMGHNSTLVLPTDAFILVADDLLPSEIVQLEDSKVEGVILKETSPTSHTAILLRGAGIPAVVYKEALQTSSTPIILDAHAGVLVLAANQSDIDLAKQQKQALDNTHKQAYTKRLTPAITQKGKQIRILANVSDITSAKIAKEQGAEGIGLLRTEFLFKSTKPTIQEQTDAYKEIFSLFSNVTVRTLDIGGDKALPYVDLPKENNPFLGIRGIRLFKSHASLLEEQLIAIFNASSSHLKIMFPMVSTVEEFIEAKQFALHVAQKHHYDISSIEFGIMIEVPSVLFLIHDFNEVVDFYSIGTNDLTQYLFAIERTHPTLLADALSPLIFNILEMIVQQSNKPVSICGELASHPDAIEKLIHLGVDVLSITPKSIPQIKEKIRHL